MDLALRNSRQVSGTIAVPWSHVCKMGIMLISLYPFGGLNEITTQLLETDFKCPINTSFYHSYHAKLAFCIICLCPFSSGTGVFRLLRGLSGHLGSWLCWAPCGAQASELSTCPCESGWETSPQGYLIRCLSEWCWWNACLRWDLGLLWWGILSLLHLSSCFLSFPK